MTMNCPELPDAAASLEYCPVEIDGHEIDPSALRHNESRTPGLRLRSEYSQQKPR